MSMSFTEKQKYPKLFKNIAICRRNNKNGPEKSQKQRKQRIYTERKRRVVHKFAYKCPPYFNLVFLSSPSKNGRKNMEYRVYMTKDIVIYYGVNYYYFVHPDEYGRIVVVVSVYGESDLGQSDHYFYDNKTIYNICILYMLYMYI